MARETQKKKKKGGIGRFFKTLIILILILVLAFGGYLFVKLGNLSHVDLDEDNLDAGYVPGYKNIVVLGVDTRDMSSIKP